ncbi:hypothetical protein ACYBSK_23355 [Streptomyces sp. BYX5S]
MSRFIHEPGQLLRARDLRDRLSQDEEMRWWHHRAVHTGLGVVEGLAVGLTEGDRSAVVAPGIAYDPRGREVVLTAPVTLALPGRRATLVARRRGPDRASLVWRRTDDDIEPCADVLLAVLTYDAKGAPRLASARPEHEPPALGFGTTPADGTEWQPWEPPELAPMVTGALGLTAAVDTTAAAFTGTPCYFAWLRWPAPPPPALRAPQLRIAQQYVEESTPHGFLFRIALSPRLRPPHGDTLPGPRDLPDRTQLRLARAQRLSVAWLGIGHREGT